MLHFGHHRPWRTRTDAFRTGDLFGAHGLPAAAGVFDVPRTVWRRSAATRILVSRSIFVFGVCPVDVSRQPPRRLLKKSFTRRRVDKTTRLRSDQTAAIAGSLILPTSLFATQADLMTRAAIINRALAKSPRSGWPVWKSNDGCHSAIADYNSAFRFWTSFVGGWKNELPSTEFLRFPCGSVTISVHVPVAQPVEHSTFNRVVARSNRAGHTFLLKQGIQHDVHRDFGGIFGRVTRTIDGRLAFQGAAEVVLAVDEDQATVDRHPF